jgi:hypothetical protein
MVIAIISESRSASVRNRDRHHLGTLIAIARNTQATLRMKTAMEFMLHGKAYLQSDQHQRIGRLLSTYGSEFPEAINPEKYLEIAHQYHREHFGPR